jgi:hypothetical protein
MYKFIYLHKLFRINCSNESLLIYYAGNTITKYLHTINKIKQNLQIINKTKKNKLTIISYYKICNNLLLKSVIFTWRNCNVTKSHAITTY